MAFQDIYLDMYSDILPNTLSDIYFGILSAIPSGILFWHSGFLFDIYSDILSGIYMIRFDWSNMSQQPAPGGMKWILELAGHLSRKRLCFR